MAKKETNAVGSHRIDGSLAIPEGAHDVEVNADEDGRLMASWSGSLYSDNEERDHWEVNLSPDRTTIHVRVDVDDPGWLTKIDETIKTVTLHRSIYVHLCMGWMSHR